MIYEYNEKEKIIKVDDRTVYLTPRENKIFKIIREKGFITVEEVEGIVCKGPTSTSFIKNYIKQLSGKIGIDIKLKI